MTSAYCIAHMLSARHTTCCTLASVPHTCCKSGGAKCFAHLRLHSSHGRDGAGVVGVAEEALHEAAPQRAEAVAARRAELLGAEHEGVLLPATAGAPRGQSALRLHQGRIEIGPTDKKTYPLAFDMAGYAFVGGPKVEIQSNVP